ncbi:hypothetical protein OIU84_019407 [Salix udensis]|uniref:Uncharacterized protein n=1 Tax=Salix udensis TaxID=889485 RepID=A0AAD6L154_9ROSI|nr:hypothetical protein OIU84_019407 [Salix udensis]KAJ6432143.1 hypothetical protein OIU84_019407 [Salix udensis]KAJ6432144.1 hypothetical protein OIU84_019407 [Salix udensis]
MEVQVFYITGILKPTSHSMKSPHLCRHRCLLLYLLILLHLSWPRYPWHTHRNQMAWWLKLHNRPCKHHSNKGNRSAVCINNMGQVTSQQPGPQVVQVSNQQGAPQQVSQLTQAIQQPGQMRSMQLPGQHLLSHAGQQMPQQGGQQMPQQGVQQMPQQGGQQMPQQGGQQMPQQVGQYIMQHQILQMPQPQGHQYAYQQPMQYMTHQQNMPPQGQQSSQHPTHLSAQGLQFPNQHEYKAALPKREEVEFQQGNQTGFSPTQSQQTGGSSSQNLSAGSNFGLHASSWCSVGSGSAVW